MRSAFGGQIHHRIRKRRRSRHLEFRPLHRLGHSHQRHQEPCKQVRLRPIRNHGCRARRAWEFGRQIEYRRRVAPLLPPIRNRLDRRKTATHPHSGKFQQERRATHHENVYRSEYQRLRRCAVFAQPSFERVNGFVLFIGRFGCAIAIGNPMHVC